MNKDHPGDGEIVVSVETGGSHIEVYEYTRDYLRVMKSGDLGQFVFDM